MTCLFSFSVANCPCFLCPLTMSLLERFRLDLGLQQTDEDNNDFLRSLPDGLDPNYEPESQIPDHTPGGTRITPRLRRPCSDSSEDEAVEAYKLKRRKQQATHICQDLGLPEGSLDQYVPVGRINSMPFTFSSYLYQLKDNELLLTIQAMLIAQYQERKKSDAEVFIGSDAFKVCDYLTYGLCPQFSL